MSLTKAQRQLELHNEYERGFQDGHRQARAEAVKDKEAREAQINLVTAVGQMLHGLASALDNGPR